MWLISIMPPLLPMVGQDGKAREDAEARQGCLDVQKKPKRPTRIGALDGDWWGELMSPMDLRR